MIFDIKFNSITLNVHINKMLYVYKRTNDGLRLKRPDIPSQQKIKFARTTAAVHYVKTGRNMFAAASSSLVAVEKQRRNDNVSNGYDDGNTSAKRGNDKHHFGRVVNSERRLHRRESIIAERRYKTIRPLLSLKL